MFTEFISRPISGQYIEKHFGEISTDCIWVKFVDNHFQEWVGSFKRGGWDGNLLTVLNFATEDKAFVVAYGNGYLVDIANQSLINFSKLELIQTALVDNYKTIIYSDGYALFKMDLEGNTETILVNYFFDEIKFLEFENNILKAQYWYYQRDNTPFQMEINVESKVILKDTMNRELRP